MSETEQDTQQTSGTVLQEQPGPDADTRFAEYFEECELLGAVGKTPLVESEVLADRFPGVDLSLKLEFLNPGGSIKDRPVRQILLEALAAGELDRGGERRVLDSSSGNAGIAYAMLGAVLDLPVTLVLPGNASDERKQRIRAHGAEIITTDPMEGYDAAIEEAQRLGYDDPDRYYLVNQYGNAANWHSHYLTTAREIDAQIGEAEPTHFVCGVGTGGSITGIGRYLKEHYPELKVIGVEIDEFPGIEGLKPLGEDHFEPPILDRTVVDRFEKVTPEQALDWCHKLAREGIFAGQSTGAYLELAERVAEKNPQATIVTLACDVGERYFSTELWEE